MTTARRISWIFALGALPFLVIAVATAPSLAAGSPWKKIDVPFGFLAGTGQLASGTYHVYARSENGGIVIELEGPGGASEFPVFTRLARTTASATNANLVFDWADGKRRLSEVWLPGKDGYFVVAHLAEKPAEHVIVAAEGSM